MRIEGLYSILRTTTILFKLYLSKRAIKGQFDSTFIKKRYQTDISFLSSSAGSMKFINGILYAGNGVMDVNNEIIGLA